MSSVIDAAFNVLYQRQIITREQILREMLRVKLVCAEFDQAVSSKANIEKIFEVMRQLTTERLGIFPADREDFYEIYTLFKELDLIECVCHLYKDDRTGVIIATPYPTDYLRGRLAQLQPSAALLPEAEKQLCGLAQVLTENTAVKFTLTTQDYLMNILLQVCFGQLPNVNIVNESIYTTCLHDKFFSYIFSVPAFGAKPDEINGQFLTKESDGIALENLLKHLEEGAVLDILLPARIAFAAMGFEQLRGSIVREYALQKLYALPDGILRPMTSVRTYLLSIARQDQTEVEVGTLQHANSTWQSPDQRIVPKTEFLAHEDWRIELFLSKSDDQLRLFRQSSRPKVKLKDVAEIFRGKSILKKDTGIGDILVLNIANIENGRIDYSSLDSIEEDERKSRRYQLQDDDVVISSRGTVLKTAVFTKQAKPVIASANLLVIRPGDKILGPYIYIFLESPVGRALLASFQRGTTLMNLNHTDLMELEIPLPEMAEQQELTAHYTAELKLYLATIGQAEERFQKNKQQIYHRLL